MEAIQKSEMASDILLPFEVPSLDLRGRLVRLFDTSSTALDRHGYPDTVSEQVGQTMALIAALASLLKREGFFSLQLRGNGAITMLVADCMSSLEIRGYAQFDAEALALTLQKGAAEGLSDLLGDGHLIFVADPENSDERYQGIVPLEGNTIGQSMESYFRQSEQIPTAIQVSAKKSEHGWQAAALVVQKLPLAGAALETVDSDEDWRLALALMGTVTGAELTDTGLEPERLIHNLFHESGYQLHTPQTPRFGCRCTREKVDAMLRQFSAEELIGMESDGRIAVNCEFCNASYLFTRDHLGVAAANDQERGT